METRALPDKMSVAVPTAALCDYNGRDASIQVAHRNYLEQWRCQQMEDEGASPSKQPMPVAPASIPQLHLFCPGGIMSS